MSLDDILGLHSQRVANRNQNAATSQTQEAEAQRQQALTGYNTIGGYGQTQYTGATTALPNVVNAYETSSGLDPNNPGVVKNPYGLTQAEEQELNGQIDTLSNRQNQAIQDLHAEYAKRGWDPSGTAASEALIKQGFGGVISQHQAQFAEQARANRANAAQNLMQYYGGQQGQGANMMATGAGGAENVAQGTQGASAQSAQQAAAAQAASNAALGNVLNIGVMAATGGFNPGLGGGGKTSGGSSAPAYPAYQPASVPGYDPSAAGTGNTNSIPSTVVGGNYFGGYSG